LPKGALARLVSSRKVTFHLVNDATNEAAAQYPNASLDEVIAAIANRRDLNGDFRSNPQAIREELIDSATKHKSSLENIRGS
jgi:acyl-CoA reductase-like NAD-dependent aldehyde dehydrogenase